MKKRVNCTEISNNIRENLSKEKQGKQPRKEFQFEKGDEVIVNDNSSDDSISLEIIDDEPGVDEEQSDPNKGTDKEDLKLANGEDAQPIQLPRRRTNQLQNMF